MRAAILHDGADDLVVDDIEHDTPGPHEVLIRIEACGLCHSDLHWLDGTLVRPRPQVLGHEAAGVVEAVGSAVELGVGGRPGRHLPAGRMRRVCAVPPRRARPVPQAGGDPARRRRTTPAHHPRRPRGHTDGRGRWARRAGADGRAGRDRDSGRRARRAGGDPRVRRRHRPGRGLPRRPRRAGRHGRRDRVRWRRAQRDPGCPHRRCRPDRGDRRQPAEAAARRSTRRDRSRRRVGRRPGRGRARAHRRRCRPRLRGRRAARRRSPWRWTWRPPAAPRTSSA